MPVSMPEFERVRNITFLNEKKLELNKNFITASIGVSSSLGLFNNITASIGVSSSSGIFEKITSSGNCEFGKPSNTPLLFVNNNLRVVGINIGANISTTKHLDVNGDSQFRGDISILQNGGISFNGSTNLDSYEQGTFTPNILNCSLASGHDFNFGFYTKIGNLVYCEWGLGDANIAFSFSAGKCFENLPFSPLNMNSQIICFAYDGYTSEYSGAPLYTFYGSYKQNTGYGYLPNVSTNYKFYIFSSTFRVA